jgi:ribosomal-protein-alanine N-acetyltransferase
VGYNLSPEFQNKGVMSEALNYIIDFGFNELKLDSIEAFTHSKMSILKVIRKVAFILWKIEKIKTTLPIVFMNM